jgi:tetratricopeptide (TPR) repeat protein
MNLMRGALLRSAQMLSSLAASSVLSAGTAVAQQRLGTIVFPNSGAPTVQTAFLRGTALLHSFEYEDAARSFREAQRLDPAFALAYWGEALTYTHPVWNQQDLAAARAALARLGPTPEARKAKAPTPREQGYLEAIEILYGEGPKPRRDTLYAAAMERLVSAFPDDDEAKTFYAVALLGLGQGTRDVWSYMRAAAVAQQVFDRNPDHPGAAHYVIHAFDDPTHAPLGLKAARAYSHIAPDAAHAQHMTSHIFVALGMWDDVVAANEQATRVTERQLGRSPVGCRHYNEWLEYGYLQQGRLRDAARLVEECRADVERQRGASGSLDRMRAMHLVDTMNWQGSLAAAAALFTRESASPGLGEVVERMRHALALFGKEQPEAALAELGRAAELEESLPFEFGPPATYKPPRELEGELLLRLNRPTDAVRAFRQALRRTPERVAALLGLAQASAKTGDAATAVATYRQLTAIWHRADPGYGPRAEAETYLARHLSERP